MLTNRRNIFTFLASGIINGAFGSEPLFSEIDTGPYRGEIAKRMSARREPTFSSSFGSTSSLALNWEVIDDDNEKYGSCRRAKAVSLTDDALFLQTVPGNECKKAKFTTGYIKTRLFKQKGGIFSCAAQIAPTVGINNAFWLIGSDSFATYEIDVVEARHPNIISNSLAIWRKQPEHKTTVYHAKYDLSAEYFEYSVVWIEEKFFFLLGEQVLSGLSSSIIFPPVDIRLSTAVLNWAGGGETTPSQGMGVHWVRAWA